MGEEPRTVAATAGDLDALLQGLGVDKPVVLVGHSYGELCTQHYASVFPEKVAVVILVDSTSTELEPLLSDEHLRLSETARHEIKSFATNPALYQAMASEIENGVAWGRLLKEKTHSPLCLLS
ncbi:pimeloyl-ACP methyl ester carboxylesterase [Brevibacillus nitrificans]|nr:pimeloyl-ACP methyl ester carboxylesterase [Brevibacillus nitrificans]